MANEFLLFCCGKKFSYDWSVTLRLLVRNCRSGEPHYGRLVESEESARIEQISSPLAKSAALHAVGNSRSILFSLLADSL